MRFEVTHGQDQTECDKCQAHRGHGGHRLQPRVRCPGWQDAPGPEGKQPIQAEGGGHAHGPHQGGMGPDAVQIQGAGFEAHPHVLQGQMMLLMPNDAPVHVGHHGEATHQQRQQRNQSCALGAPSTDQNRQNHARAQQRCHSNQRYRPKTIALRQRGRSAPTKSSPAWCFDFCIACVMPPRRRHGHGEQPRCPRQRRVARSEPEHGPQPDTHGQKQGVAALWRPLPVECDAIHVRVSGHIPLRVLARPRPKQSERDQQQHRVFQSDRPVRLPVSAEMNRVTVNGGWCAAVSR